MVRVPVLEIGGTHAAAALVDTATWTVVNEPHRVAIDADGSAERILDGFAAAGAALSVDGRAPWAVAMPDPFDYVRGVGRFHDVGKYESLDGVDVRGGLAQRLPGRPDTIVFCNDADAFTVGEWVAGAATGTRRAVGLTLGTGVGTGWVDRGHIADPGTPPGGRAHRLHVDGGPLEDTVSRRAIRRHYAAATSDRHADVREIAERAGHGEDAARAVLATAFGALGRALARPLHDFGADVVVVGGSMSQSWGLFEPWFRTGAGDVPVAPVRVATDPGRAPLIGAAYVAVAG